MTQSPATPSVCELNHMKLPGPSSAKIALRPGVLPSMSRTTLASEAPIGDAISRATTNVSPLLTGTIRGTVWFWSRNRNSFSTGFPVRSRGNPARTATIHLGACGKGRADPGLFHNGCQPATIIVSIEWPGMEILIIGLVVLLLVAILIAIMQGHARTAASERARAEAAAANDARERLLQGHREDQARWAEERRRLEAQLETQVQKNEQLQGELARTREQLGKAEGDAAAGVREIAYLRTQLEHVERLRLENLALAKQLADVTARAEEKSQAGLAGEQLLSQAREILTEQFKAVSSELLERKSQHLTERQSEQLHNLLKPFREQIEAFQREVRETNRLDLEGRSELKGELKQLRELNQSLSSEAHALAQALRGDVKKRGNWGELVLERLLELAGLQPGREFDIQPAVVGHDQQRQFPDVVLRLTDDRSVVIDSKLSLTAYEQLAASDSDEERERARKAHRAAMRTHIENLAQKRYSESPDLKSPEFVVMFVPIEAAYLEAIAGDDSLYELAIGKRIIVASPGMLLGLLRIVHELWRVQERQKNAEEIARVAGTLYDAFVRTAENLNVVAQRMGGAQDELAEAIKRIQGGRGNILGQIERLRALGAKASKSLPAAWQNQVETEELPALPSGDTTPSNPS